MSTTTPNVTRKPRTVRPHLARLSATAVSLALLVTGATVPSAANAALPKVGDLIYEGPISSGKFLSAKRIAVDPSTGLVFVTDTTNDKIYKLNDRGILLAQRGGLGGANGLFNNPYGIDVDANGYVYVADTGNNRIQKFTTSTLGFVKAWGSKGSGDNNVDGPRDVDVDGAGNILVADTNNQRIHKFGPNGGHISEFGAFQFGSYFKYPGGVASVPGGSGNVLIADTNNDIIQVFGPTNNYLTEYGKSGVELNQYRGPRDLAVEKNGTIYVADYDNKRIQQLNAQGAAVKAFPLSVATEGLAFDEELGRLYFTNGKDLLAYRKATAPAFGQGPATTGTVGKAYSSVLTGSGFPKVTGFKLVGGALPSGLTLAGSKISGVPTKAGSYEFWLKVENGVQISVTKKFTITISEPVIDGNIVQIAPTITTASFYAGKAGNSYSAKIARTGFPQPTFSVTAGALPPGLKLVGSPFSGYTISGTPLKAGSFPVTLQAQNGVAPAASKNYTMTIAKASSKVTAKFSTRYPKVRRTNIKARITVTTPYASGLSKTGKVRVYYGKKRVKTYTVKSSKGIVTVRLPKFTKKGKTRVTLRYLGNSAMKASKRTIYVRVRR